MTGPSFPTVEPVQPSALCMRRDSVIDLLRALAILYMVGFWHLCSYSPALAAGICARGLVYGFDRMVKHRLIRLLLENAAIFGALPLFFALGHLLRDAWGGQERCLR